MNPNARQVARPHHDGDPLRRATRADAVGRARRGIGSVSPICDRNTNGGRHILVSASIFSVTVSEFGLFQSPDGLSQASRHIGREVGSVTVFVNELTHVVDVLLQACHVKPQHSHGMLPVNITASP